MKTIEKSFVVTEADLLERIAELETQNARMMEVIQTLTYLLDIAMAKGFVADMRN